MLVWAVHIADGFLVPAWLGAGCVLAGGLALVGAWRIRDEEIPRIALMTAVFFIASQVHLAVGPSSAHLLLNGLLGIVLGRRALLAIPVGLAMQAALFGHGGYTALGINSCVMALPAVAAWGLFALLNRVRWGRHPGTRTLLVGGSACLWGLAAAYGSALLLGVPLGHLSGRFHVATVACAMLLGAIAAVLERRLEQSPEFAIGLFAGELAVLLTIGLHCAVLVLGGKAPTTGGAAAVEARYLGLAATPNQPDGVSEGRPGWRLLALVVLLVHLPVAALEGLMLGFLVGFLARVKPELIGGLRQEADACPAQCAA